MKKKNMVYISNRGACRLIWFAVGQGLQLVLHKLFLNWWEQYQIPLCAASGFVVFLFLFIGCWITAREVKSKNEWEDVL